MQPIKLSAPDDDLYVDENNENNPPAGFVQQKEFRTTSGILQPATNVPVLPLEEAEKLEETEKATGCKDDGAKADFGIVSSADCVVLKLMV